jgi:hypothetical protein
MFFVVTASHNKLFVAGGVTADGYSKDVEIIDLLNPENICDNLESLQDHGEKTASALISEKPTICGNEFLLFIVIKKGNAFIHIYHMTHF